MEENELRVARGYSNSFTELGTLEKKYALRMYCDKRCFYEAKIYTYDDKLIENVKSNLFYFYEGSNGCFFITILFDIKNYYIMDKVYDELKKVITDTYYEKKNIYELDIKLKERKNFTEEFEDVDFN